MECAKSTVRSQLRRQKIYSNKNAHELLKAKEHERKNSANRLAATASEGGDEDAKVEYKKKTKRSQTKQIKQIKQKRQQKRRVKKWTLQHHRKELLNRK